MFLARCLPPVPYVARLAVCKAAVLCIVLAGLAEAKTLRLVAVGDSLTHGYGLAQDEGFVPQLEAWLRGQDLVYDGLLEAPKGKAPEDWEPVELPLFRSTKYGDDQDRPIKKSDGKWTYFGADLAYHMQKAEEADALMALALCQLDVDGLFDESDINLHLSRWLDGIAEENSSADYVTVRRAMVDVRFLRRCVQTICKHYHIRTHRLCAQVWSKFGRCWR